LKGNVLARCGLELRACACRAKRPITVCASPKRERNRHGIDLDTRPPCRLITVPVKLAMMKATNRNRELIADFAAQRSRLRKAKMMRIGRFSGRMGEHRGQAYEPPASSIALVCTVATSC
jgi:hypothetical protein